jgi:hypothetical protein
MSTHVHLAGLLAEPAGPVVIARPSLSPFTSCPRSVTWPSLYPPGGPARRMGAGGSSMPEFRRRCTLATVAVFDVCSALARVPGRPWQIPVAAPSPGGIPISGGEPAN